MNTTTRAISSLALWAVVLGLMLGALLAHAADAPPAGPPPKTDLNVLFIGNSMTWFCNMPRTVAELAEQMDPPVRLHVAMAVGACNTLANPHVREGSAARKAIAGDVAGFVKGKTSEIAWLEKTVAAEPDNPLLKADLARLQDDAKALAGTPKWDIVVLQPWGGEDVKDAAAFAANVKILQDDIAKSSPGARVIMYMDPTRRMDSARQEKDVRGKVLPAYRQLVTTNGVEVAPAALAGALICKEKPEYWLKITELPNDAHHGLRGAYAVACTIVATIFDRSPEGLLVHRMEAHYQIGGTRKDATGKKVPVEGKLHMGYFDDGPIQMLNDEDMRFIQSKAWAAWQEWKGYGRAPAETGKGPDSRKP
jgi:hypothetical protein